MEHNVACAYIYNYVGEGRGEDAEQSTDLLQWTTRIKEIKVSLE